VTINGQTYVCIPEQVQSQASHSVVICPPTDGEIHFWPVHLTWNALAAPGEQPKSVQIFVDGKSFPNSSGSV